MREWRNERFLGFRVNCESVPRLPAWAVRWMLEDPRGIPYLLLWRWMDDPPTKEVLRISLDLPSGAVQFKRIDGTSYINPIFWRHLPRNGGRTLFLICIGCGRPRRHLYAWSVSSYRLVYSGWKCRECAGLRYRSEGNYIPPKFKCLGGIPRTPVWDPAVFSDPRRLAEAGFLDD